MPAFRVTHHPPSTAGLYRYRGKPPEGGSVWRPFALHCCPAANRSPHRISSRYGHELAACGHDALVLRTVICEPEIRN
jgi:hypothetical protein